MEGVLKRLKKDFLYDEKDETIKKYSVSIDGEKGVIPFGVVFPRNTREVIEIVNEAKGHRLPLVPVSSGEPHFRNDTLPLEGGIVVDTKEMNRILRIDRKNRVAVVEPGVKFKDYIPAVKEKGLRPLMPLMPRPEKSVLASALEREPVIMPRYHWDASDPLLCLEVVFGTGDVFRTGEAAGPGGLEEQWSIGGAQKFPLGPHQVDYFRLVQGAQGTMGIVTWASIKCELLPDKAKFFLIESDELEENLINFTYRVMKLDLADEVFILNRINFERCFDIKAEGNWIAVFGIGGAGKWSLERVNYKTEDIKDVAQDFKVDLKDRLRGEEADFIGEKLWNVNTDYWKIKNDVSVDIFFITTLDKVNFYINEFNTFLKNHNFSHDRLGIYIQPVVQGTSCHLEFNLYTDTESLKRVRAVYEEGSRFLFDRGAFFARPYGIWSKLMFSSNHVFTETLKKVKRIFDPENIMNPGKLCF